MVSVRSRFYCTTYIVTLHTRPNNRLIGYKRCICDFVADKPFYNQGDGMIPTLRPL